MRPALVVVLVLAVSACAGGSPPGAATAAPTTVHEFALDLDKGAAHVSAAGLKALPKETLDFHEHAHLDISLDGERVTVPAYLGLVLAVQGNTYVTKAIAPLHTHDATGIVHVEAPTAITYTLGQVFKEWGQRLDRSCVGTHCVTPGKQLRVSVNGVTWTGDPAAVTLKRHDEIFVQLSKTSALVDAPSSYTFPSGL